MVGVFQINVVVGILLAYASNYLVREAHLGAAEWRWQLGVAAIPALGLSCAAVRDSAQPALGRSPVPASTRLCPYSRAWARTIPKENWRRFNPHCRPNTPWPTSPSSAGSIAILCFWPSPSAHSINWLASTPSFITSTAFLPVPGFSQVSGDLQGVAIGATNLVFTLLGMTVIDKLGRRTLLLVGAAGTAVCLAGVAWVFYTIRTRVRCWGCWWFTSPFFALSQGAVIWVYIGEVFSQRPSAPKAQAVGNSSHWIMNAMIASIFPILAARTGGAPFVFFSAMTVVQFFVVCLLSRNQGADIGRVAEKTDTCRMIAFLTRRGRLE